MLNRLDLKFLVMLFVTLAGVLIPVWLSQIEQSSKALRLQLISSTELGPTDSSNLEGVRVSVDGYNLERPIISVLELSNIGSKPILHTEFESSIQISAQLPARLIKAQLTSVTPIDLKPIIAYNSGVASIQPLLMNPKDTIRVSILTAEASPDFVVRSRVAGISSIDVYDLAGTKAARKYWMRVVVGVFLFVVYTVLMTESLLMLKRGIVETASLCTALIACFGGLLLSAPIKFDSIISLYNSIIGLLIAAVIAAPILAWRMRKSSKLQVHPASE